MVLQRWLFLVVNDLNMRYEPQWNCVLLFYQITFNRMIMHIGKFTKSSYVLFRNHSLDSRSYTYQNIFLSCHSRHGFLTFSQKFPWLLKYTQGNLRQRNKSPLLASFCLTHNLLECHLHDQVTHTVMSQIIPKISSVLLIPY